MAENERRGKVSCVTSRHHTAGKATACRAELQGIVQEAAKLPLVGDR